MTSLSFDEDGVDVEYEGIDFRLDKELIEEALRKPYPEVTDHEVFRIVEEDPALGGQARQVKDILE